ncbi:MAG: 3-isopropylmalate dehydrogenase [Abitibacteriaceae bacterium]|nr:3-isopropylmalate dehydrogenase [Abditibacteriaceae bacterium]
MAKREVVLIPGDGIGPEVAGAATQVVAAAGVEIDWVELEAGAEVAVKYGTPLPDTVVTEVRRVGVALKGPVGTPIGGGFASPNVALRKALDLYAAVRPCQSLRGVPTRYENVNLVMLRENTEDLYSGIEHLVQPGIAESIKIVTERACMRISRYAFELARREGRPKVTAVHKANIMKISDGLFLECARRVARNYSEIQYEELIVDNVCMQLVTDPTRYSVLLMGNLYGDIVSDLCAGLVGGLGVVPGANIGDNAAVFEAVHGSAPDIAGKGVANPTAIILSACQMLDYLEERQAAARIRHAVDEVLVEKKHTTRDLGGSANTREYTDAIIEKLRGES